jgi:prepilin-type N-terminal cleavage/methylation domain-containing protein
MRSHLHVRQSLDSARGTPEASDCGFTIAELLVSLAILLTIASVVATSLLRMTESQATIWNRTEMHSGIRSATELLQQEVGQAGRISLPAPVTMSTAIVVVGSNTVNVNSTAGMFVGELVTIDAGPNQETIPITAVNNGANQFTANFAITHNANVSVEVLGGFANGIIPTNVANGSTPTVLKLFGDINGDGSMVYIEYTCDTVAGNLYRNVVAYDAANKPAVTAAQVLLSNIQPNPGNAACFTYQQATVAPYTFVTNVAITLTVQTQQKDLVTKAFQKETKALLNVAPRNVFNAWELASITPGGNNRVQPTPPSVTALLQ